MQTDRVMVALVMLALLAVLPLALRALAPVSRRRAQTAVSRVQLHTDQPTILYFWSEDCHQCRTAQAPALDRLTQQAPVRVVSIDAVAERGMADRFGVMTVPTTVVLAPGGTVRAVNHGFASLSKLRTQVAAESATV